MNTSWINAVASPALFLIYIAASCGGLYLVKAAPTWKSPEFFFGFGLYGAGAILWMVILRLLPLSLAFPVAAGSLVIGTMLTGVFFLSEQVSPGHLLGAFLVIAGITLMVSSR